MTDFLEIDGSVLEGGGQILRSSISLSATLGIPVRVFNIRANRRKPGLAAQHLAGLNLVADMCRARLRGDSIGSTEIQFTPGKRIRGGHYVSNTCTAGSISLLLQVALPCALLADEPVFLHLTGGTNVDMAPQIEYVAEVFRNALKQFGATFDLTINRRGYFPRGYGIVEVQVNPVENFVGAKILEKGIINKIYGWSFVSGKMSIKVAMEMYEGLSERLVDLHEPVEVTVHREENTYDNCSGIIAVCETTSGIRMAADALSLTGAGARKLGRAAGESLRTQMLSGACLDTHLQDQVILFMTLAVGKSAVRVGEITQHTKTAMHISEKIAKTKFDIIEDGEENIIQCTGLRVINRFYHDQIPAKKYEIN